MFGIFGRGDGEAAKAAPALGGAYDLVLGFETGYLTLTAGGMRFRLEREDVGRLADREWLARAFENAGPSMARREFDKPAAEESARIGRLLGHGLTFDRIAKLLNEDEKTLREFYGWSCSHPQSNTEFALSERRRQAALDILKLTAERIGLDGQRIEEARLCGRDVLRLLGPAGDVKAAAKALGVNVADLEKWLADNAAMLQALR